jgi:penicillin-binding protein 2
MKRFVSSLLFILSVSLLGACSVLPISEGQNPIPGLPNAEPTSTLQDPEGVAKTYLDAWEKEDYEGMYSLLSENSRLSYTLEEFTTIHTNALEVMRATGFDLMGLSDYWDGVTLGAQYAYRVTYNSIVLGEVTQEPTMNLTREDEGWAVMWDPGMILAEMVGDNTLTLSVTSPARANIYDAEGDWLVRADTSVVRLQITTGVIDEDVEADMLNMLGQMLRLSPERIRQQYAGAPAGQLLALGDVDLEIYQNYRLEYESYPQLSVSDFETTGRRYYNNGLAAHLLGYTGLVPQEECESYQERGYDCDDIVGLAGLEQAYEETLSGQRGGTLSAFTPSGEYYGEVASREPQPAEALYLTIDRDMQAIVENAIADAYRFSEETWAPNAGGASVVVVDVNTGAVVAMASYPSFDPNVFHPFNNHPYSGGNYINDILTNRLTPLFNRSTQGAQPAGSIFKIVTATAALQHPSFGYDWRYNSTGIWQVTLGGETVEKRDWREDGHGTVNISEALMVSCNSCFYEVGLTTGRENPEYLANWAREYHLGQEFGLPIAEVSGNIPGPNQLASDGRQWSVLDNVNMAIGQGDVLVTPLQVTMMTAAVANNGTVYQPQFVDRVGLIGEEPSYTFEPQVVNTLDLPPEDFEFMREGMRRVAEDALGTAEYRLGNLSIPVAGKTGTAQVSSNAQPIAWFTGFVPYDEPEYAITVMVENGGEGSVIASPIFRRIVERWYDTRVLDYPRDWGDPERYQAVEEATGE